MKNMKNRLAGILCLGAVLTVILSAMGAADVKNHDAAITYTMTPVATNIAYSDGGKYDLVLPVTVAVANDYLCLAATLATAPVVWENEAKDMRAYDVDLLAPYVPNLSEMREIAYSGETYSISYFATSGEFITLEYFPDGTKNRTVREAVAEWLGLLPTDGDVIAYNGKDQSVVRYQNTAT